MTIERKTFTDDMLRHFAALADPSAPSVPAAHTAPTVSSAPADYPPATAADVERLVGEIEARHINLCEEYPEWVTIGFALAEGLAGEGRTFFHRLSRLSTKYSPQQADRQYDACLRSSRAGITLRTLFYRARQAGIEQKGQQTAATVHNEHTTAVNNEKSCSVGQAGQAGQAGQMDKTATYTFSDKLDYDHLPPLLKTVYDSMSDAAGRDKMLLGVLTLISGMLPDSYYGCYDRRRVYAPVYTILYGGFATGKGELEACKQILTPLKQEMRRRYEARLAEYQQQKAEWDAATKTSRGPQPQEPPFTSPFLPANSSASALYRALDANGGWGIMFETEADSLSNMLSKSEYGDYSDLLRKAHHHEACPMVRVSERVNIELSCPRLAVLLTSTGSQLPLLLPPGNVANGLASRFLFYQLPGGSVSFRNVFASQGESLDDIYRPLGDDLLRLVHALHARAASPIEFTLTSHQQENFVTHFSSMITEQYQLQGEGMGGFVYRLALEAFRYAMVMAALRRLSERSKNSTLLFDEDENQLILDDADYHTVITIMDTLIQHTAHVYAIIGSTDKDPFKTPRTMPAELERLYQLLPPADREFTLAETVQKGLTLGFSERSTRRMLGRLVSQFGLVMHPRYGVYQKTERKEVEEA